jgi:hypothetical protein
VSPPTSSRFSLVNFLSLIETTGSDMSAKFRKDLTGKVVFVSTQKYITWRSKPRAARHSLASNGERKLSGGSKLLYRDMRAIAFVGVEYYHYTPCVLVNLRWKANVEMREPPQWRLFFMDSLPFLPGHNNKYQAPKFAAWLVQEPEAAIEVMDVPCPGKPLDLMTAGSMLLIFFESSCLIWMMPSSSLKR